LALASPGIGNKLPTIMREKIQNERRMTLNSISDFIVNDENVFKQFEEALLDGHGEKTIKGWIMENKDVLNGRFGKKLETPLHR
jgi:hypothetical protein